MASEPAIHVILLEKNPVMSSYQYYEFQAIDYPLNEAHKKTLRKISSRAEITSRKFSNHYHWGEFHGNPRQLMDLCFDLHLYLSSWGRRRFIMRIPKKFIGRSRLMEFVREIDEVEILESGESIIVDIDFTPEESEESAWIELDATCEEWLESLAPLRSDVISGDLRLFYLLWLTAVERGFLRDETKEPLAGIGPLSAPLDTFAKLVKIDSDLVQSAAELSGSSHEGGASVDLSRNAIASIPNREKVELLRRVVNGDPHVAADIRKWARSAQGTARGRKPGRRRTVAEIRKRMLAVGNERRAAAVRRREAERLRKAQEAEERRRARIDSVRRRGELVWDQIETEINSRSPQGYDRAIELLMDLRTLAEESGTASAFSRRVRDIKERHRRKWRLIERLHGQRM